MEKFEFKSQVCTTIEQSERLMKLGLKKETADMHLNFMCGMSVNVAIAYSELYEIDGEAVKPAWSLYRLFEMLPDMIKVNIDNKEKECFLWYRKTEIMYWPWGEDGYSENCYKRFDSNNMIDNMIDMIECLISDGLFDGNYLSGK